jgi:hypothetical protein
MLEGRYKPEMIGFALQVFRRSNLLINGSLNKLVNYLRNCIIQVLKNRVNIGLLDKSLIVIIN